MRKALSLLLFSVVLFTGAAFSQSNLYTFAPGQENSAEFRAVVGWIKSFDGGPDCSKVVRLKSDAINGHFYTTAQAVCSKPSFEDVQVDAALLQRHPAVSLVELKHAFKFGDPAKYENFRYVVEPLVPRPPETSLPPQPDNPVGPEFLPGKFFAVAGDIKPAGFVYADPGGRVFRKACRNQLGSAQSCWYDELK